MNEAGHKTSKAGRALPDRGYQISETVSVTTGSAINSTSSKPGDIRRRQSTLENAGCERLLIAGSTGSTRPAHDRTGFFNGVYLLGFARLLIKRDTMSDKHNLDEWETLERDAERGYEIMGKQGANGWQVEVRFDNGNAPEQPERSTPTRDEALKVGRELATMRSS